MCGRDARSGRGVRVSDWMTAGGETMSVALVEHTGPWTADDVEALPDAGDHARFEVYEGGVLVVSPVLGVGHQRASYRLHRALAQAAITAGAGCRGAPSGERGPARREAPGPRRRGRGRRSRR